MTTLEVKKKVLNAINRFLIESAPYWNKSNLEKLIGSVDSDVNQTALKLLESDGVIKLIKHPDCYFIITADYIKKEIPPGYQNETLKFIDDLLKRFE